MKRFEVITKKEAYRRINFTPHVGAADVLVVWDGARRSFSDGIRDTDSVPRLRILVAKIRLVADGSDARRTQKRLARRRRNARSLITPNPTGGDE